MNRILCIIFALLLTAGCMIPAIAAAEPPAIGQVTDLTATLEDETTVSLQWSAVEGATGYRVAYFNEKTERYKAMVTTTATQAVLFSLDRGKTYRLRVRAFHKENGVVTWGEPSADVYAATAPGGLRGLYIKDLSKTTVTLGWKQTKGATHYEVYLFDDTKQSFRLYGLSGHLQMTVKNLQPNRLYRFRVRPFRLDKGKYAPSPDAAEIEETTAGLRNALAEAGAVGIKIAYGSVASEIKEVSRSYKEARMAADVGRIFFEEREIISYSGLGIGRLIYQLPIPLCRLFIK